MGHVAPAYIHVRASSAAEGERGRVRWTHVVNRSWGGSSGSHGAGDETKGSGDESKGVDHDVLRPGGQHGARERVGEGADAPSEMMLKD